jgi:hypothetical protein
MRLVAATAALAALTLGGCAAGTPTPAGRAGPTRQDCRSSGALPDPRCTPGAVDPRVDQADLKGTICLRGYTSRVRPVASYTGRLKRRQLAAYGWYAGRAPSGYEEDHLIPLELGGAPSDPRNLWPEARSGASGSAGQKDVLENYLHRAVCSGAMTLRDAQRAITRNWRSAYLETTG